MIPFVALLGASVSGCCAVGWEVGSETDPFCIGHVLFPKKRDAAPAVEQPAATTTRPADAERHEQLEKELDEETERALKLEEQADVVIEFQHSDDVEIKAKGRDEPIRTTEQGLPAAVVRATSKRCLAFVILGKPVFWSLEDEALREKADTIEETLKSAGFSRVVIVLGTAWGLPIYRE